VRDHLLPEDWRDADDEVNDGPAAALGQTPAPGPHRG